MKKGRLFELYKQADYDHKKAKEELYRPEEDVVNYSACIFSRSAMYHFLSCLYVLNNNEEDNSIDKGTKTLDELIAYAKTQEDELKDVDFSSMRCKGEGIKEIKKGHEIYFCNNTAQIQSCSSITEKIKDVVIDKAFDGKQPQFENSPS
jgi:hypothetical protein